MKKIAFNICIIAVYVLIGWATALHQFQTSSLRDDNFQTRSVEACASGILWPVLGVLVWSDVYLWEREEK